LLRALEKDDFLNFNAAFYGRGRKAFVKGAVIYWYIALEKLNLLN
jgi:hypothetical protein